MNILFLSTVYTWRINAIFYNDDTMHEIYQDKGEYDFIDQLPQIIYSFLISLLFGFLFEMLVLTEDVILDKEIKISYKKIIKKYLVYEIAFFMFLIIVIIFIIYLLSKRKRQMKCY